MKALILAAGKGSRIETQTAGKPKSLLPLGNTTLLGHSLRRFEKVGITDIVVVTGFQRHAIIEFLSENWSGNCEIVYNPHYNNTNVLYSFWLALPYLKGSDFVFLHADTVFEDEVLARLLSHDANESFVVAVDNHACEEEEMKVKVVDGYVTEISKTMDATTCDGEFLGIARISEKHIADLQLHAEQLFEDSEFQSFFEKAVQRLIDGKDLKVSVSDVTGLRWREVDFEEDYAAALKLFSGSKMFAGQLL